MDIGKVIEVIEVKPEVLPQPQKQDVPEPAPQPLVPA